MIAKFNWHSVCGTQKFLAETIKNNETLTFLIAIKNGKIIKKNVQFKDFLKFFWYIYDSKTVDAKDIVVTDINNKILFKFLQNEIELLPKESEFLTIKNWNTLTEQQKDSYLKILYAQIQYANRFN